MDRVAIITGGSSTEREIALSSAKNVQALLRDRYDVIVFNFPTDIDRFIEERASIDVVIPVMHGRGGEDGALQGFLETLDVPYLFSGVAAHAAALDKQRAKTIVAASGIATPHAIVLRRGESATYQHPAVVKPLAGGSSVATAVVQSQEDLEKALAAAFAVSEEVLVEDFVRGQEFTVAVVSDEQGIRALPVIMIKAKQGFFDYESKYNASALAEEICPAPIPDRLASKLQDVAVRAHEVLGCRHVSRTDIIVDDNETPWYLETNTIPGMTETSLLPKACEVSGVPFVDMLASWIETTKRA